MKKPKDPLSPTEQSGRQDHLQESWWVEATEHCDLALHSWEGPCSLTTEHLTPFTFHCLTVWPWQSNAGYSQQEMLCSIHRWRSSVITVSTTCGLQKKKKKKRVSVWHAAGAWWILACGIRVEYGGRLWMERPVFNLRDRENKSKREWWRWGRELEVRLREAMEVREHSWQELPLGPVPVFQRKCRRPNLRPPEEGDLLAPAYCPFYHLVLLMSLSPYGQGLIKKKRHRRHTGVCTCHENGFLRTSEGIVSSRHATLWPDRNPYK